MAYNSFFFSAWDESEQRPPANASSGKFVFRLTNDTIPIVEAKIVIAGVEYITPRALIDTGASDCMVFSSFIKKINALPCDMANVQTSNGFIGKVPAYNADLFLPAGIVLRNIKTIWTKEQSKTIDMIIGHSVLSCGLFVYDGIQKIFSFEV